MDFPSALIRHLCPPDGLVLDPFAGGGTVAASARREGRHSLSFEIDPDVAERARQRVAQTPVPLFTLEPEQAEMWGAE
jgi:DNA modification methylase